MNNINLTDPPKFSDLSKSDRLAIVYNEVVTHIERLKQSGRLKEGQDLNAEAIVSQMMLESSWMVSPLAKRANNFGGLTTGKYWKGDYVTVENDKFTGKTYHYRKYKTPLEGIRAQVEFYLPDENPSYEKAGVLTAKTPEEHFARVKSVGYAEDPNYVGKLTKFVKSTIRPKLKRGGNQEAIDNWYLENENYRINEKYKDKLNQQEVEENNWWNDVWTKNNEIEELQRQQAGQAMLEYERQARINQLKNTNKQIFEKPELKQNTIKALNLTPLQSDVPLILDEVKSSTTEIPSTEILKAEAKKQQQEAKHQEALTEYMAAPIVDQNMQGPIFGQTSMFGQGQLFRNGGHIYPKYFKNGGSGNNQPINPITFNVDAETENLKIWDPKSQSYVISNIPYTGDTTGMMSHWADRYAKDDTSQEAVYAKLKKQQDFIDWEAQRADIARQQLADRTDKLGKGQTGSGTSLSDFLPAATARTLMPSSGGYAFGCTAGTTGCFPPTKEELNDPNFQNQLTIPYFVESERDLINPALSRNRTKYFTAPKDFKSTYSGHTFRPNIFPEYSVPNTRQYFNKYGELVSGPDTSDVAYSKLKNSNKSEGAPLYRTTIQGINWQNRKKAKPGDPLNVYTGSASYLSQLAKLGMGEVPVGEWLEPGDRITKGGRSDGKIYLGGKGGHYHNTGIGNFVPCIGSDEECGDSLLKGYHNPGNPYTGFFSSGYWDRYNTNYLNNYLISRYEGDLPYHKYTKKEVQNKYGFNDAEADAFIKNYEKNQKLAQLKMSKIPFQPTNKIEIDTSLPTELQDSRSEKEKKKDKKQLKKYYNI